MRKKTEDSNKFYSTLNNYDVFQQQHKIYKNKMPFNNKDSIIGYSKYRKTKTKNQFRDLLPDVDL